MSRLNRRQFLRASGVGVGVGLLGGCAPAMQGDFMPKRARRVVVIGGGWGGTTAAKYVRPDPSIEVVLSSRPQFISPSVASS
jgi:sulfide dehydrogenase [flavocytochrome c] flavoprotein subunit